MKLTEDAENDVRWHRTADELVDHLARHFYRANPGANYGIRYGRYRDDDRVYGVLTGNQLSFPPPFDKAAVLFRQPHDGDAGGLATSKGIVLSCIGNDLDDDDYEFRSAASQQIADAIKYHPEWRSIAKHEFIHMLDRPRNPAIKGRDVYDAAYYNSPHEYNAYFHNVMHPLMRFIDLAPKAPNPNRLAQTFGIDHDPKQTLNNLVHSASREGFGDFLGNLNQRNQKALVRRFYGLHQKAMQAMNRAQPVHESMQFHDLDPDRAYEMFRQSYEAETGTSWSKEKFLSRARNWTFYGDENGYVAVRQQASGMKKLVGAAGNKFSIYRGFADLMQEGGPIWGAVSADLVKPAVRLGMIAPHRHPGGPLLIRTLIGAIPASVFGGVKPEVLPDGGLALDYADVGRAEKYLIGNKAYFAMALHVPAVKEHLKSIPGVTTILRMMGLS